MKLPVLSRGGLAVFILCALCAPGMAQAQRWTPAGPYGGTVGGVAVHPRDPQVLYAAGVMPRLLKSRDGGASWQLLPAAPFSPAFVALDPTQPATVYAGYRFSGQIYKSTDSGRTWGLINAGLPGDLEMSSLAVDPARTSRLYLGSPSRGVWRSADGGASWQRAGQGLPAGGNVEVTALAVPGKPAGTAFAGTAAGLFRTRDAGQTWSRSSRGLPAGAVLALAVAPSDSRTLYASLHQGIFRSQNGGDTWSPAGGPPAPILSLSLAVHPQAVRTVYAGTAGAGIFRTTDGGRRWTATAAPPASHVLALALDRAGVVYAGLKAQGIDPGGVLRSANGGASWQRQRQGMPGLTAKGVAVDPGDREVLVAGLNGPGLFRSAGRGEPFVRTSVGLPTLPDFGVDIREVLSPKPGTFYAVEVSRVRLWKSTDGGLTWNALPGPGGLMSLLRADPVDPDTLYVQAPNGPRLGLYRSTDGGVSWAPLAAPPAHCDLRDLAVARESASSPAILYLLGSRPFGTTCGAGFRPGVFRSPDGGASWVDASTGLIDGHKGVAIAVDPQDSRLVYLGLDYGISEEPPGLWKSTDSGTTWQRTPVRFVGITALAASPVPGVLWAAVAGGDVLRSEDAGETWQDRSGGQFLWNIEEFAFDPADPERVYLAGFGGVWALAEETP